MLASPQPYWQPQATAGQHARRPAASQRQYHSSRITAAPSTPARGRPCGRPPWPPPRSPAPQTCHHQIACPAGKGRGQPGARNQGRGTWAGRGWDGSVASTLLPSPTDLPSSESLWGFSVEHCHSSACNAAPGLSGQVCRSAGSASILNSGAGPSLAHPRANGAGRLRPGGHKQLHACAGPNNCKQLPG